MSTYSTCFSLKFWFAFFFFFFFFFANATVVLVIMMRVATHPLLHRSPVPSTTTYYVVQQHGLYAVYNQNVVGTTRPRPTRTHTQRMEAPLSPGHGSSDTGEESVSCTKSVATCSGPLCAACSSGMYSTYNTEKERERERERFCVTPSWRISSPILLLLLLFFFPLLAMYRPTPVDMLRCWVTSQPFFFVVMYCSSGMEEEWTWKYN